MVTPMTPAATSPLNVPAVPSPCVDICRLDAQQLCIGCRRTLGEITEWPRASEARRREILREIELRPPPRA
jgi:predicted Fe-S protein YdhL (DUF1289 family)